MKKVFLFSLMMLAASCCLTSCSDNDDNNSSPTTPTASLTTDQVKAIVATSENQFFSSLQLADFAEVDTMFAYFARTYSTYTRQDNVNVIPLAVVANSIRSLVGGDLSAIPNIISKIDSVRSEYRANTVGHQWDWVAGAEDDSTTEGTIIKHLTLYFADKDGKGCTAQFIWHINKSVTIADADQSISVKLPEVIYFKLYKTGEEKLAVAINSNFNATTKTVANDFKITLGNYALSGKVDLTNTVLTGYSSLDKSGVNMLHMKLGINGQNLIDHFSNASLPLTTTSAVDSLFLPNDVTMIANVTDPTSVKTATLSAIKNSLVTSNGRITDLNFSESTINSLIETYNKSMTRTIVHNGQIISTLKFVARANPTLDTILGHLTSTVTYPNGDTGPLNGLFTKGESTIYFQIMNAIIKQIKEFNAATGI